jgi:hypothetical protein
LEIIVEKVYSINPADKHPNVANRYRLDLTKLSHSCFPSDLVAP